MRGIHLTMRGRVAGLLGVFLVSFTVFSFIGGDSLLLQSDNLTGSTAVSDAASQKRQVKIAEAVARDQQERKEVAFEIVTSTTSQQTWVLSGLDRTQVAKWSWEQALLTGGRHLANDYKDPRAQLEDAELDILAFMRWCIALGYDPRAHPVPSDAVIDCWLLHRRLVSTRACSFWPQDRQMPDTELLELVTRISPPDSLLDPNSAFIQAFNVRIRWWREDGGYPR